jgi:predicted O-methyltransferase YrrM
MIDPAVLSYLEPLVAKGMHTLETGTGISTVLFALRGADHISITPISGEVELIKRYCQKHSISLQQVEFIIGRSEDVLPRLDHQYLDMVLIDGGHGFPN